MSRITKQHEWTSKMLRTAAVQINQAYASDEISRESASDMHRIVERMHNYVLADSGVYSSRRFKDYLIKAGKFNWNQEWLHVTAVFAAYAIAATFTFWILT
jgi:hypothetical protein